MNWESIVIVVVGGLLLTLPSNWAVRRVLRMARHEAPQGENRAGRWIGVLERLLIYVLVLIGAAAAAGLVVAAKSILRFPEISRKPAAIDPEYVLIGSLASWLLAFTVGALAVSSI
ncbi:MAG TPA: hypothetical protein VK990_10390 [Acidimicrobiia bacterium]|nr:hypothetical protein [Acidimicrobiia bacterium]